MNDFCDFCDIIDGKVRAHVVTQWPDAIAFFPLNPVTNGHVLVVPRQHVRNFKDNPTITGAVARRAAEFAADLVFDMDVNLITSAGPDATQTVEHLHFHLVPRRKNDGLLLPWSEVERS